MSTIGSGPGHSAYPDPTETDGSPPDWVDSVATPPPGARSSILRHTPSGPAESTPPSQPVREPVREPFSRPEPRPTPVDRRPTSSRPTPPAHSRPAEPPVDDVGEDAVAPWEGPRPSGDTSISADRRQLIDQIIEDPHWDAVPALAQEQMEHILATAGSPEVFSELKAMIAQAGFATRLSDGARGSLLELVRLQPSSAGAVNANFASLRTLFEGVGYERLAAADQQRVRVFLCTRPEVGGAIGELVSDSGFRSLDQERKVALFDRLERAEDPLKAIMVEKLNLSDVSADAEIKADKILRMLANLEDLEDPKLYAIAGILGVGGVAGGLAAANYFGQGWFKNQITDLMSGPDADDVYRALALKGKGQIHDVMEQLVESPGRSESRTRLVRILDKLSPDNAARFVSDMSLAVGRELDKVDVFDAVVRSFSLNAYVDSLGINAGIRDGVVTADLPGELVGVKGDLSLDFDPHPLRQALKLQKHQDFESLITEVLDTFTKNHDLASSPQRWSDDQKREYFATITRLAGGDGVSELTQPVNRPI